jgi:hypothetical protein
MHNAPAKWWKVVTLSLIVTALGIIPGLGLPGGTMLMLGGIVLGPLGYFFFPAWNPETWPQDAAWPAAILLTFTLFPFVIIARVIEFRYMRKLPSWKRSVAWFGMYVAWSVIGYAVIAAMIAYGM